MQKRKVQVVIFRTSPSGEKEFLILKTNERRGNFWQSVTGGVEEGESFDAAAFRETREETACKKEQVIRYIDLKLDFEFHDQWGNDVVEKVYLFEVSDFDLKIDPSEHTDFKWVNQNVINEKTVKFEMNYKAIKECIEKY